MPPADDEAVALRRARLVSEKHRRRIAAGLRLLVDLAEDSACHPRRPPLRRTEIKGSRGQILALAAELEQEPEVQPRGVIFASRLIDDATSPVYAISREPEDVRRAVRHARTALLPR